MIKVDIGGVNLGDDVLGPPPSGDGDPGSVEGSAGIPLARRGARKGVVGSEDLETQTGQPSAAHRIVESGPRTARSVDTDQNGERWSAAIDQAVVNHAPNVPQEYDRDSTWLRAFHSKPAL